MSLATATSTQLVEEYLAWMQHHKRRSPSTVYCYGRIYTSLLAHLDGRHLLATTHEDLERFVFARPRTKTRGPRPAAATVKVEAMALRSLFKWLSARGLVHRDPTLRLLESVPVVHNEDPRPVPEHLWKVLWFSDLSDSDRVALGLGFMCGLRRREVVGLAAPNFLPDGRLTGIRRKGGKVEGFPLASAVALHAALSIWLGRPDSAARATICGAQWKATTPPKLASGGGMGATDVGQLSVRTKASTLLRHTMGL